MRESDGVNRRSPTSSSVGREKKPSVSTAEVPSSTSSVDTPSQVIDSAVSGSASGTSKRLW